MARLTRLVLMLTSVIGFSATSPIQGHAGVIPWTYNGPVSNSQAVGYAPVSSSSGYATTNASYTPVTVAYAPVTTASYGYNPSYGAASGCSCNQSSYYPSTNYGSYYGGSQVYYSQPNYSQPNYGSTGCNSCGTGNCSNSAPVSSSYQGSVGNPPNPAPDPYNNSSPRGDVNLRLNELEHQLKVLDHRQKEDEKFLNGRYKDDYRPDPYSPNTYGGRTDSGRTETVPQRQRKSFQSEETDRTYSRPRHPTQPPVDEDVRKPVIGSPTPIDPPPVDSQPIDARPVVPRPIEPRHSDDSSSGSEGGNSSNFIESEPEAFRLDNLVTTRAVAPRERMQIATNKAKTSVANRSTKKIVKTSDTSRAAELVRH